MGRMASDPDRPVPTFELRSRDHAGETLRLEHGAYRMTLSYDDKGRLVRASSEKDATSHEPAYAASLTLDHDVPRGGMTNSFGDTAAWRDGEEHTSGSYGPYEQETREKVAFDAWAHGILVMMCGRNAG